MLKAMTTDKIGPLTILDALGAGAGSQVFRVVRKEDSHEYALKVVSGKAGLQGRFLEQLRNEFRIGRMVDHPHLVKVYAQEIETDWLFRPKRGKLLLEYASGGTLDKLPPLKPARFLRVFECVASAMTHMHEQGICHADLKPGNIILGPAHNVKVIDYGLSRLDGEPCDRLQGTPEYMAPETKMRKVINPRTDIFNLGATTYRLLTHHFLPISSPGVLLDRKAYSRMVVPVATLNPAVPAGLCELVHWCISYEAEQRPQSMAEVQSALHDLASGC